MITAVLNSFARDNEQLVDQLFQIIYYFRGGLTRDDAWMMTLAEREKAIDFINKRFKDAQALMKSGMSVFL